MGRLDGILPATPETPLGVVDGVSDRHGHRAPGIGGAVDGAGGVDAGNRPSALVLAEEVADGGWGIGDNILTRTTRSERDRTVG
jgi:hypothetical protein